MTNFVAYDLINVTFGASYTVQELKLVLSHISHKLHELVDNMAIFAGINLISLRQN